MAALTKYVDTAAAGTDSGDDWTNAYRTLTQLGTYLSGKNFTTDGDNVTVYFRGGADTTSLSGNQTAIVVNSDVTNFIKLVMDGTNGSDKVTQTAIDTGKYHIIQAFGGIRLNTGYVEVDGLQIELTGSSTFRYGIGTISVGGTIHVRNCIVKRSGTGSDQHGIYFSSSTTGSIKNCIVYDFNGTSNTGITATSSGTQPTHRLRNNTVVNCTVGYQSGYEDCDMKNCLAVSCTTDFVSNWYNTGGATDYNGYEGATAPSGGTNTNDVGNTAVDFTDEGSDDFTLAATDNEFHAAGIGTTESHVLATDIFGTSRASGTCSMGAVEYVAAGGGAPLFTRHILNQLGS